MPNLPKAPRRYGIRDDAHRDMQEAVATIHNALYPPLCMKHALKIGYEFKVDDVFMALHQFSRKLEWPENEVECIFEIKIVKGFQIKRSPDNYKWFYPVNEYGQPAHGEAESYVNAFTKEALKDA